MKKITLPIFLEFVELRTKVASVFPMLIGILWAINHYHTFNWLNTIVFVLAALCFDMCTTAINNTMDYKKAVDEEYKQKDNVIGKFNLNYRQMVTIIFVLLSIAVVLSIVLVFLTDIILLPIGAVCFLIGIFYTFGPIPLSRLPLGEIFSGVTMGFGIFFISIFVQNPSLLMTSAWTETVVHLNLHWKSIVLTFVMSVPLICLIANIMLANNLCDYEQDLRNHRYTLVHYITPRRSLMLYVILSIVPWIMWAIYILFGYLPVRSAIAFVPMFFLHFPSIKRFCKKQIKKETFVESIKSFVLFSAIYVIILGLDSLI
ncbi:1,4-dihydroxy-2-naphthoate polyprenyltransferase [Carnobacteriaceae bacterium zg-ZUI240]|nr:1,4-dihydroxy-2-naphthoate polyprenyltransferase [Carnobacteriaceae bacterium zg-ZUI240]